MPCITKDQLKQPTALRTERFDLAELGHDAYVMVRSLTARQLLDLQQTYKGGDTSDLRFALDVLARTLIDDAGALLFASPEEVLQHLGISLPTFTALAERALEISGLLASKN